MYHFIGNKSRAVPYFGLLNKLNFQPYLTEFSIKQIPRCTYFSILNEINAQTYLILLVSME